MSRRTTQRHLPTTTGRTILLPEFSTPPIPPVYWQTTPNETIEFGRHKVQIGAGGQIEEMEVRLCFAPDARLEFFMPTAKPASVQEAFRQWAAPMKVENLRLLPGNVAFDAFPTQRGNGGTIFSPTKEPIESAKDVSDLTKAVVHLFNFPSFHGADDYCLVDNGALSVLGRVILRADGWEITIAATDRTEENEEALDSQGGYCVTHTAGVHRGGVPFTSEELSHLLAVLHRFLSFALGRWAGIGPTAAFDATGKKVWEQWGISRASRDSWNASLTWFSAHHASALASAFPGYWALSHKPQWKKSLSDVVYWYVRANAGAAGAGTDTGIIIAQAALELLAWTYCIQDQAILSKYAFGRGSLSASDRLRLLGHALKIPVSIPSNFKALGRQPGAKWADGPEAITAIRNALVHPNADRAYTSQTYFEAWKFSLWLIEAAVLRLIG